MFRPEVAPIRVLLIDDNPVFLQVAAKFMRRSASLDLTSTAQGPDGLALARELLPEVVVTDVNLAGVSGLDLLPVLRREFPQMGLVVLSLHDTQEIRRAAQERGADAFVNKTEMGVELERTIGQVAQRRREAVAG